jgi:hypothetical protein
MGEAGIDKNFKSYLNTRDKLSMTKLTLIHETIVIHKKVVLAKMCILLRISHNFNSTTILNPHQLKCTG